MKVQVQFTNANLFPRLNLQRSHLECTMNEKEASASDHRKSEPKTLESVINASSVFQRPLLLLLFRGLPSAFSILGMTFLAPTGQEYWCAPMYNMTLPEWKDFNNGSDLHCHYRTLDDRNVSCDAWQFDHSVFPRTFKSEFNSVCDRSWIVTMSDSLLMVGMMMGNFFFSHISDWYGRKMAIGAATMFTFLAAMAMAIAPNYVLFVILRTIMAMGLGGNQNGPITLAMETVNPTKRAAIAFCDSFGWIVGLLLFPIVPWFVRDWRYLQILLSLGSIPILIMVILVDESPKWLLATGHKDRARPVIRRLLKNNGMSHEDSDVEEVIDSSPVVEQKQAKANILELVNNRTIAITTISFLIQYPISILVYYDMMFFMIEVGSNPWISVLFTGLFEMPCLFLVVILVKFCRRKLLYYALYTTSIVSAGALYFTKEDQEVLRMALAIIAKLGVQLLFAIMGVHVNETYITRTRAIALGLCSTFSRFGAITAPNLKHFGASFHAVCNSGACILGLLVSLPLKETFNKPLPDATDEPVDSDIRYLCPGDVESSVEIFEKRNSKGTH